MQSGQDIAQLKEDIDQFIKRLSLMGIKGRVVNRLEEIKDNLENQASEWYHLDLRILLNPEMLLAQAHEIRYKKVRWIGYVEFLRNLLVLLPILFTWLALSRASAAYYFTIASDAASAGIPFLVQWEQGFNGLLPRELHFSQVAYIDAVILAVIVLSTFIVHAENNILLERSEKRAIQLVNEFDDLLIRISKVFVQRTDPNALTQSLLNSIKDLSASFREQSEHLQDLLAAEQERLEKLNAFRIQELEDFEKVSKNLRDSAVQLTTFSNKTEQSYTGLKKELHKLSGQVNAIPQSQDGLNRTLQSLEGHFGKFELVMENLTQKLDSRFSGVSHALHVELTSLTEVVSQASENQNKLTLLIQESKKSSFDDFKQVEDLVRKLEQTSENYELYSDKFIHVYGEASKELRNLSENLREFVNVLKSNAHSSTSSTDRNVDNLVRELQNLSGAMQKNRLLNFFGSKQQ